MNIDERIAAALERIADALEAKRRKEVSASEARRFDYMDESSAEIYLSIRDSIPRMSGRKLTLEEIISICGIKYTGRGQRQAMGRFLTELGFQKRRTAQQRYYIAPVSEE
jgi:hypothetical protein